jgi:hypothetical protein
MRYLLVAVVAIAALVALSLGVFTPAADAGSWHCYFGYNLFGVYDAYCYWY